MRASQKSDLDGQQKHHAGPSQTLDRPAPEAAQCVSLMSFQHALHSLLLERAIRILVVGCGGNGSAIASGLPYLHQAMLAGYR